MKQSLPLFRHNSEQTIAWYKKRPISANEFLNDVRHTISRLPAPSYVFNLSNDRYHFMVGLAAAIVAGKTTLLPPSSITGVINGLIEDYPNSCCLSDAPIAELNLPQIQVTPQGNNSISECFDPPSIPVDNLSAILFTSGSTGKPKAHPKYWGDLQTGIQLACDRFQLNRQKTSGIVATVPPQHMYGLETTILVPWFCGMAVHAARPLFPADLRDALNAIPDGRLLITTPVHLNACVAAELKWPAVDMIISATAPLSKKTAMESEQRFNTKLHEIYGSTETGSIASRQPLADERWCLFEGMTLSQEGNTLLAKGKQLPKTVPLSDKLEILEPPYFVLIGRNSDMVKIAGKRASLGELNLRLNEVQGVQDGVYVITDREKKGITRLTALVVAPETNKQAILKSLAESIDSAFLPRPLIFVDSLPRNATGKLPQEQLMELIKEFERTKENN
jgi:acyl-coenzyme A synthetase/AMP-(fatty) acid ligase